MHSQKRSKRPLVNDDDDPSATKRARTLDADASSVLTSPHDSDMDIDVRFLPEDAPAKPTKRKKSSASTKKKNHVLYSDDDESHDPVEDHLSDDSPGVDEDEDDGSALDTPPKHAASKAKAGKGKAKSAQPKGAQAKGIKEKEKDKEVFMKDERKLVVPPTTVSRASSTATQSQPSDLFSNDEPGPSTAVDPPPDAIPKKRKLPTIKKTKTAASATGTSTSTTTIATAATATTTQKASIPPVQELTKPSLPTSEQRKQALTGVRDVDLADSRVYAELFKGAGGNTPRSGLKNAEERRKELDRMRDEARARRAEEAKFTFDLQAQADKIARFEQRLRAENSTVIHPNFLAAKFRDEWEMERRHRKATTREGEA